MIYDVSHRTDIPAFFWDWFANRLDAGYLLVRNPHYPEKVSRYDLSPEVCDGFRFLSKDFRPAIAHPKWNPKTVSDAYPTMWAPTLTPYVAPIECNTPEMNIRLESVMIISDSVGPKRLDPGYSPILITDEFTVGWHIKAFSYIVHALKGYIETIHVAPLNMYGHVAASNTANMREPKPLEMQILLDAFVNIAGENNIIVSVCPAQVRTENPRIDSSLCFTLEKFGYANDIPMKDLKFPKNSGLFNCGCADARDVAGYGTCPHGCLYCYANIDKHVKLADYDPTSEMLLDTLRGDEIISEAKPRIYRKRPKRKDG